MRKIISILILAFCMTLAMPVQAQLLKFGVKGGLNLSDLDISGNVYNSLEKSSTGFFIGPMAEVNVPLIGLGVDGALMYSQRGKGDVKQQGIEVPINLKYTLGSSLLGIYIAAGPDFFFNFKDSNLFKKKDAQVGLNIGAGVKLLSHLQAGVNYQFALSDSFEDYDAKYKTWQISVAYLF